MNKIKSQSNAIIQMLSNQSEITHQFINKITENIKDKYSIFPNFKSLLKDINLLHENFENELPLSKVQDQDLLKKIQRLYKILRNNTMDMINEVLKRNNKAAYKALETILQFKGRKGIVQELRNSSTTLCGDEITNSINKYFRDLYKRNKTIRITNYLSLKNTSSSVSVSETDWEWAISHMNKGKAVGPDLIPDAILYPSNSSDTHLNLIRKYIENILKTGKVPISFKAVTFK